MPEPPLVYGHIRSPVERPDYLLVIQLHRTGAAL